MHFVEVFEPLVEEAHVVQGETRKQLLEVSRGFVSHLIIVQEEAQLCVAVCEERAQRMPAQRP